MEFFETCRDAVMCCPNPWPVWLLESWLLRCVYLETNQTDNCGRFCSIRGNPFAARCLGSISQERWAWFLFALQQRLLFDLVQAIHETGLALQRLHAVEKYHSIISKDTGVL